MVSHVKFNSSKLCGFFCKIFCGFEQPIRARSRQLSFWCIFTEMEYKRAQKWAHQTNSGNLFWGLIHFEWQSSFHYLSADLHVKFSWIIIRRRSFPVQNLWLLSETVNAAHCFALLSNDWLDILYPLFIRKMMINDCAFCQRFWNFHH